MFWRPLSQANDKKKHNMTEKTKCGEKTKQNCVANMSNGSVCNDCKDQNKFAYHCLLLKLQELKLVEFEKTLLPCVAFSSQSKSKKINRNTNDLMLFHDRLRHKNSWVKGVICGTDLPNSCQQGEEHISEPPIRYPGTVWISFFNPISQNIYLIHTFWSPLHDKCDFFFSPWKTWCLLYN